jgi:hypothetical protein
MTVVHAHTTSNKNEIRATILSLDKWLDRVVWLNLRRVICVIVKANLSIGTSTMRFLVMV